jgi:hypothetical protein
MAITARIGYGTTFTVGDGGSPEVFTELAEVTNVTGPAVVRETHDATHMGSPNRYREFVAGLVDGGEVTVDMNYVAGGATEILLNACLEQVAARNYRITTPNTEVLAFSGFCTAKSAAIPLDDLMTLSATFKVSGDPAFMSIT